VVRFSLVVTAKPKAEGQRQTDIAQKATHGPTYLGVDRRQGLAHIPRARGSGRGRSPAAQNGLRALRGHQEHWSHLGA
jgi:hypothetical protein